MESSLKQLITLVGATQRGTPLSPSLQLAHTLEDPADVDVVVAGGLTGVCNSLQSSRGPRKLFAEKRRVQRCNNDLYIETIEVRLKG